MSKDQELVKVKRDTKSLVMKNLIVMAVLIILALTGVISWFTNKTKATADGINVICEAPKGLKIAVVRHGEEAPDVNDETQWSEGEITLNKDAYPFLKEQSIIEITSDGINQSLLKKMVRLSLIQVVCGMLLIRMLIYQLMFI